MKRLLLLAALIGYMLTSCESNESIPTNDDTSHGFEITSSTEVKVDSGSVVGFISYTVANPTVSGTVDATTDVVWVTSLDCSVYGKVTFTLARNESIEQRQAIITLSYEGESHDVTIIQAGIEPNTIIEAPILTGHFYGRISTPTNNFYLCFSDNGLGTNYLTNNPNTYYYIADLYLDDEPVDENFRVPDGTYTYDMSSGAPGTFAYFSWYQENDASGFPALQRRYSSGTLVVDGNKLTLTVLLEATDSEPVERHVVTYEGDYKLIDLR